MPYKMPSLVDNAKASSVLRPMVIGVELSYATVNTLLPNVHQRVGEVLAHLVSNVPMCIPQAGTNARDPAEDSKRPSPQPVPVIVLAEHFSRFPLTGKGDLLFATTSGKDKSIRYVSLQEELLRAGIATIVMSHYPNQRSLNALAFGCSGSHATKNSISNQKVILPRTIEFSGTIINVLRGDVFVVRVSSNVTEVNVINGQRTESEQYAHCSGGDYVAVVHLASVRCPNVSDPPMYSPADRLEGHTLKLLKLSEKARDAHKDKPVNGASSLNINSPLDSLIRPVCVTGHPHDGLAALRFSQKHLLFQEIFCVCASFVPSDKDLANNTQEVLYEQQEHFVGVVSVVTNRKEEAPQTTGMSLTPRRELSALLLHINAKLANEGYLSVAKILYSLGLAKLLVAPEAAPYSALWIEHSDLLQTTDAIIEAEQTLYQALTKHSSQALATYASLPPSLLQQHQRFCWSADPLQTKSLLQAGRQSQNPWGEHRIALKASEREATRWLNERHKQKSDREDEMQQQAEYVTALVERSFGHGCGQALMNKAEPIVIATIETPNHDKQQNLFVRSLFFADHFEAIIDKTQPFVESFVSSFIASITFDTGCTATRDSDKSLPPLITQLQSLFAKGNEDQLRAEAEAFLFMIVSINRSSSTTHHVKAFADAVAWSVIKGLAIRHDIRFQLALARLLSVIASSDDNKGDAVALPLFIAAMRALLEAIGLLRMPAIREGEDSPSVDNDTSSNSCDSKVSPLSVPSAHFETCEVASMRAILMHEKTLKEAADNAIRIMNQMGIQQSAATNSQQVAQQILIAAARALLPSIWCPVKQPSATVENKKVTLFEQTLQQRLPPPTYIPLKMVASLASLVATPTTLKGHVANANITIRKLTPRPIDELEVPNSAATSGNWSRYLIRVNLDFTAHLGQTTCEAAATQLRTNERGEIIILPASSPLNYTQQVNVKRAFDVNQHSLIKNGYGAETLIPSWVSIHPFPETVSGFAIGYDPGLSGIELADAIVQLSIRPCASVSTKQLQSDLRRILEQHINDDGTLDEATDSMKLLTELLSNGKPIPDGSRGIDGPLSYIAGEKFAEEYKDHYPEYYPSQGSLLRQGVPLVHLTLSRPREVACVYYIVDVKVSYNGRGSQVASASGGMEEVTGREDSYEPGDQSPGDNPAPMGEASLEAANPARSFEIHKRMIFLVYDPKATENALKGTIAQNQDKSNESPTVDISALMQKAMKPIKSGPIIVDTEEAEVPTVAANLKDGDGSPLSDSLVRSDGSSQPGQQQQQVSNIEREARDVEKTITNFLSVGAAAIDGLFTPFVHNVVANCLVSRVAPSEYLQHKKGNAEAAAIMASLGLSASVISSPPQSGSSEEQNNGLPSTKLLESNFLRVPIASFGGFPERSAYPSQAPVLSTISTCLPLIIEIQNNNSENYATSVARDIKNKLEVLLQREVLGRDSVFVPISIIDEDVSISRFERQCLLGDVFVLEANRQNANQQSSHFVSLNENVSTFLKNVSQNNEAVRGHLLTPQTTSAEIIQDTSERAGTLVAALSSQMAVALIVAENMNTSNVLGATTSLGDASPIYVDKYKGNYVFAALEHLKALLSQRTPSQVLPLASQPEGIISLDEDDRMFTNRTTKAIVLEYRRKEVEKVSHIADVRRIKKYTGYSEEENDDSDDDTDSYYFSTIYALVDSLSREFKGDKKLTVTYAPIQWTSEALFVSADADIGQKAYSMPLLYHQSFQQIASALSQRLQCPIEESPSGQIVTQQEIDRISLSMFSLSASKLVKLKAQGTPPSSTTKSDSRLLVNHGTNQCRLVLANNLLAPFAAYPRMLFASHYDHHRGLVPKATRETARGFAHMDVLLQRMRFPRLPNLFNSGSWDELSSVVRTDANTATRQLLLSSGDRDAKSTTPTKVRSPFVGNDRVIATSHQLASFLATLFFAFPNTGTGSAEGEDLANIENDGNKTNIETKMDANVSLGVSESDLKIVAGALKRDTVQMNFHGTLELITRPPSTMDKCNQVHLIFGNRPSRLFTRLQSPTEVLPRKLPMNTLSRLISNVGFTSSLSSPPQGKLEVEGGGKLLDNYNYECIARHGQLPTRCCDLKRLQPRSKETTSMIFSNSSKDVPFVMYRPQNGWCVLGEPLAATSHYQDDAQATVPTFVVHQYIPVRLPKGSDLYKQSSYGQVRRDDVFEVFMGKSGRSLDLIEYWKLVIQSTKKSNEAGCKSTPADGTFKVIGNANEPLYMMYTARRTVRTSIGVWWNVAFPLDCVAPTALIKDPLIVRLMQKYCSVPKQLTFDSKFSYREEANQHQPVVGGNPFENATLFADAEEASLKSMLLGSSEWLFWLIALRLRFYHGDGGRLDDTQGITTIEQLRMYLDVTSSAGSRSAVIDVWEFTEAIGDAADELPLENDLKQSPEGGTDIRTSRTPTTNDPAAQHIYFGLDNNVRNRMASLKICLSAKAFDVVREGIEEGAVADLSGGQDKSPRTHAKDPLPTAVRIEVEKFMGSGERIWRIDRLPSLGVCQFLAHYGFTCGSSTDIQDTFLPFIIEIKDSREVN